MNTLANTTSLLTHSLAWALLYSLWQGALVFGVLFMFLRALPSVSARIKYCASFSAITALFAWFVQTLITQYSSLYELPNYPVRSNSLSSTPGSSYYLKSIPAIQGQAPIINSIQPKIESCIPYIIFAYTVGLCFMLCKFFINMLSLRALRTQGINTPGPKLADLLLLLQKRFEIARPVKLFLSNRITTPMMIGALKPVILLPIATINYLTTEQVETILLHELAHIKRHDYLLNIFQTIAETILFFNPFVWLISRIIRREREHCCDDIVIANMSSPLPYAKALAMLENTRLEANNVALAATGNKQQLLGRIKRIMGTRKNKLNYTQLTIVIVVVLAVTLTVATFTYTQSFAQKSKNSNASDTTMNNVPANRSANNNKKLDLQAQTTSTKQAKENKEAGAVDVYNYQTDSFWTTKAKMFNDEQRKHQFYPPDTIANNYVWDQDKELEYADKELNGPEWEKLKQRYNSSINDYFKIRSEGYKWENGIYTRPKTNAATEREMKETLIEFENAPDEIRNNAHVKNLYGNILFSGGGIAIDNLLERMLEELQKDKLISRNKKKYIIKTENGALYVNDVKQTDNFYTKYSDYLGDRMLTIYVTKRGLDITFNNNRINQEN